MKRSPRQIAGLVMMGSGLLLTTGALFALVLTPPVYEATARIYVSEPALAGSTSGSDTNALPFEPYWFETEFEKLQGRVVLYPVITNLSLTSRWAGKRRTKTQPSVEETYQFLKQRVEIRQLRSTKLIEIVVSSEDSAEAAQIANTIATAYRNYRNVGRKAQGMVLPTQLVQIVDPAEPPTRPSDKRDSMGLLPIILFAVGLLDVLVGYFVVRPTLSTHETIASDGRA